METQTYPRRSRKQNRRPRPPSRRRDWPARGHGLHPGRRAGRRLDSLLTVREAGNGAVRGGGGYAHAARVALGFELLLSLLVAGFSRGERGPGAGGAAGGSASADVGGAGVRDLLCDERGGAAAPGIRGGLAARRARPVAVMGSIFVGSRSWRPPRWRRAAAGGSGGTASMMVSQAGVALGPCIDRRGAGTGIGPMQHPDAHGRGDRLQRSTLGALPGGVGPGGGSAWCRVSTFAAWKHISSMHDPSDFTRRNYSPDVLPGCCWWNGSRRRVLAGSGRWRGRAGDRFVFRMLRGLTLSPQQVILMGCESIGAKVKLFDE